MVCCQGNRYGSPRRCCLGIAWGSPPTPLLFCDPSLGTESVAVSLPSRALPAPRKDFHQPTQP